MTTYGFANRPATGWPTLVGNITSSATSLTVSSASAYPQYFSFIILVDNELMLVTGGQGTTTFTVTRGIEGTTAASHTGGATVYHVPSAATLTSFVQQSLGLSSQTPLGNPTLALGSAGNLSSGTTYYYYVAAVDANGESFPNLTWNTNGITVGASASQINLTSIPTGTSGTVARRIYRTYAGQIQFYLAATLNDNTTTAYTDNMSDAVLATQPLAPFTGLRAVLSLGTGFSQTAATGSFSGSQSGTVLGLNIPNNNNGLNLIDLQQAGTSLFNVNPVANGVGQATAGSLRVTGLSGAQGGWSRNAGRHDGAAPVSGTFSAGDWVVDLTTPTIWLCTSGGTPGTWTQIGATMAGGGEVSGTDFKATGLTGSTAASRYVGATASGAPASGAHLLGDYAIDQTGTIWICTTAGTPGTWTKVLAGGAPPTGSAGGDLTGTYPNPTFDLTKTHTWSANQTAPAFIASGLTGATAASRYVGATASGAPASGTFAVGDYIIDQTGKIYVCTAAGTPGTWTQVGASSSSSISNGSGSLAVTTGGGLKSATTGVPTTSNLQANLSSATLATGSTDLAGAVLCTQTASAGSAGRLFTLTFNAAFTNAPFVNVWQISQSQANTIYGFTTTASNLSTVTPIAISTTAFDVYTTALSGSAKVIIGYQVIGS